MENPTPFYVPFTRMFKYMLINQVPMVALMGVVIILLTEAEIIRVVILLSLGVVAASIFASWLTTRTPRVYLSKVSLKCHDSRGKLRKTSWSMISSVKLQNRLGIKYLLVSSKEFNGHLPVPLFLDDMDNFLKLVLEFAGDDHIFTQALEKAI